jgi:hypothetical protein
MEADWGWAGLAKLEDLKPEALRHVLTTLVERIVLDPKTREFDSISRYRCQPESRERPHGDLLAI